MLEIPLIIALFFAPDTMKQVKTQVYWDAVAAYYIDTGANYSSECNWEIADAIERYGRKVEVLGQKESCFYRLEYRYNPLTNLYESVINNTNPTLEDINCGIQQIRNCMIRAEEGGLPSPKWLATLPPVPFCSLKYQEGSLFIKNFQIYKNNAAPWNMDEARTIEEEAEFIKEVWNHCWSAQLYADSSIMAARSHLKNVENAVGLDLRNIYNFPATPYWRIGRTK